MKSHLLVSCFSLMICFQGCQETGTIARQDEKLFQNPPEQKPRALDAIEADKAITIAQQDFDKSYGKTEGYRVVSCEQSWLWRVIFDPKDSPSDGIGIEYLITKRGGSIVLSQKIPVAIDANQKGVVSENSKEVSRGEAILIGRKDAVKHYGSLAEYELTVCETSRAWRVTYSLKEGWLGGGPEYVIDKRTGRIINKHYYQ